MKNEFPALCACHEICPEELNDIRGGKIGWAALVETAIDIYENWDEYWGAFKKGFVQGRQAYGYNK